MPGARNVARGLREGWERIRPFPRPRYRAGTPRAGSGDALDPNLLPSIATLAAAATSTDATSYVSDVLDKLTPDRGAIAGRYYYHWAQARFGKHLRHADILTALWAAAFIIRPSSYLEIGVHRGRSLTVVGAVAPRCAIYGFDLWIPEYAGASNPGPEFVRGELRAVGHSGDVELVSGDSRKTLPAFLHQHPDLYFDLVTIDGDKSVIGAATDFAHALPRLKIGGAVVFDDMPVVPVLRRVWERVIERDRRYLSWEFSEGTRGVAAAIRIK